MCLAFDYKLAFCLFYVLFVVPWEIQFLSLMFFTMFLCYKNLCGHLGNTISWTYAVDLCWSRNFTFDSWWVVYFDLLKLAGEQSKVDEAPAEVRFYLFIIYAVK